MVLLWHLWLILFWCSITIDSLSAWTLRHRLSWCLFSPSLVIACVYVDMCSVKEYEKCQHVVLLALLTPIHTVILSLLCLFFAHTKKNKQAPPLIYRFFSDHFRLPSSCLLLEQDASSLEALCRATFSNKARSSTSLFGWLCCHKVSHFPLFSNWVVSNILKTMRTTNLH